MFRFNWQDVDYAARQLVPFFFSLFLVLVSFIHIPIFSFSEIAPVIPLVSIYHWAVYRPNLVPAWSVFLLGAIYDLLSATPPGLYALIFLTVYGLVIWQRKFVFGKNFFVYWFGFVIVYLLTSIQAWIVASIWYYTFIELTPIVFQLIIITGLFPVIALISLGIQRAFLSDELDAS